jgi:hypothetical protein
MALWFDTTKLEFFNENVLLNANNPEPTAANPVE